MIGPLFRQTLAKWRALIGPLLIIVITAMSYFLLMASGNYIREAAPAALEKSRTAADVTVYASTPNVQAFATELEKLPEVEATYIDVPLIERILSTEEFAHVSVTELPPAEFRAERILGGKFPSAENEIALSYQLAHRLKVKPGDFVSLPNFVDPETATLRYTVTGLYAPSPVNLIRRGQLQALHPDLPYAHIPGPEHQAISGESVQVIGKPSYSVAALEKALLAAKPEIVVKPAANAQAEVLDDFYAEINARISPFPWLASLLSLLAAGSLYALFQRLASPNTGEIKRLRLIGASRIQIFAQTTFEVFVFASMASTAGALLGFAIGEAALAILQIKPSTFVYANTLSADPSVFLRAILYTTLFSVVVTMPIMIRLSVYDSRRPDKKIRPAQWYGIFVAITALVSIFLARSTAGIFFPDTRWVFQCLMVFAVFLVTDVIAVVGYRIASRLWRAQASRSVTAMFISSVMPQRSRQEIRSFGWILVLAVFSATFFTVGDVKVSQASARIAIAAPYDATLRESSVPLTDEDVAALESNSFVKAAVRLGSLPLAITSHSPSELLGNMPYVPAYTIPAESEYFKGMPLGSLKPGAVFIPTYVAETFEISQGETVTFEWMENTVKLRANIFDGDYLYVSAADFNESEPTGHSIWVCFVDDVNVPHAYSEIRSFARSIDQDDPPSVDIGVGMARADDARPTPGEVGSFGFLAGSLIGTFVVTPWMVRSQVLESPRMRVARFHRRANRIHIIDLLSMSVGLTLLGSVSGLLIGGLLSANFLQIPAIEALRYVVTRPALPYLAAVLSAAALITALSAGFKHAADLRR